ncbi:hypothetical protein [Kibdelosporangium philippinense]
MTGPIGLTGAPRICAKPLRCPRPSTMSSASWIHAGMRRAGSTGCG